MRRGRRRGLSLLLVLVMLLGLLPGTAWAAGKGVTITFQAVSSIDGFYVPRKEMTVLPGTAQQYGYANGAKVPADAVTILDVLVQAHVDKYGEAFTSVEKEEREGFLKVSDGGFVQMSFQNPDAGSSIQLVNGGPLGNATVATAVLKDGDVVENLYPMVDAEAFNYGMDTYAYFTYQGSAVTEMTVSEGTPVTLTLMGDMAYKKVMPSYYGLYEPDVLDVEGGSVFPVNEDGSLGAVRDESIEEEGLVTFKNLTLGDYTFTVQGSDANSGYLILCPWITIHVVADDGSDHTKENVSSNLTWETIRGDNLRMDAVSKNLTLPTSFMGESLTWSCDDQSGALFISGNTGFVSVPLTGDVRLSLTARLTDKGTEVKTFPLTIKAEGITEDKIGVTSYDDLIRGIARGYTDTDVYSSAIENTDLPWALIDLAAYNGGKLSNDSGELRLYNTTKNLKEAKYVLADYVLGERVDDGITSLKNQDLGAYYIYNAPYVLLALDVVGVDDSLLEGAVNTRENLVSRIAGYLNDPSSYLTADVIGPALAALAKYNTDDNTQVKTAVEKGISWLSDHQNNDGTWDSNSNSTALAIVGLCALGIDAHTDSRFVKNNRSAVEGLLSFALTDNSGFGHMGNVTYNGMATEQGFRALVSYARMKANGAPYNIYLEAKNSKDTVPAPNITATVKPGEGSGTGGSGENPQKTVTVTVSVMVPPEGGAEGQYTYNHDSARYTNLLGSSRKVTVASGTTALSVLKSALDGASISYRESSGYVSEINGLAAFDHGPRSGWQYMVDGTAPQEGASTYTFSKNAELVWYYTDDYTKEKDAGSWDGGTQTGTGAEIKEQADGSYQVTLPKDSTGSVLVTIPKVSKGDLLVIVHADGTQEVVKKSVIQDGTAYLMLDENATVKAVDYVSDFADVKESAWYADAVDFTAGRGLFSGVGGGNFAPNETLNRGMVVTVLYALEEAGAQKTEGLFSDVAGDAWYAQGTAWAVKSGIVSGYGDGQFGPDDAITREQLALMLYRYAQYMKLSTGAGASLNAFGDKEAVSSWAQQAMSWAVSAGILGGTPAGNLNPGGTATRAEAAVMVSQFVTWMLKGI